MRIKCLSRPWQFNETRFFFPISLFQTKYKFDIRVFDYHTAAFLRELLMCYKLGFLGGRGFAVWQPKHVKRYGNVTPLLGVNLRNLRFSFSFSCPLVDEARPAAGAAPPDPPSLHHHSAFICSLSGFIALQFETRAGAEWWRWEEGEASFVLLHVLCSAVPSSGEQSRIALSNEHLHRICRREPE